MEPAAAPPPKPMTPEELERFQRRERQVSLVHAIALAALLVAGLAAYRYGDSAWFRGLFVGVVGALVAVAAIGQLLERCPRCGARLHRKLLVASPEACATCGVPLRAPPAEG
jgi:predicted cobalt transporter CbtA